MSPHDGGGALSFPHAAPPSPGTLTDVAPGVRWLRMPLPFALDHINLWLVEDGEGWAIVDSGLANDATRALWERILTSELGGRPVTRLIVTHFHPDHMGLAGWLTEKLGIALWTTEAEWLHARMLSLDDTPGFVANARDFFRRVGLDEDSRDLLGRRGNDYRSRVSPIPYRYHRIADGMELTIGGRRWHVVVGRGHAPEHACLYCPDLDLLIAGDQVLPKISPNISLWPQEPEGDPLGHYLQSLEALRVALPASTLVLPSHNLPFYGLHRRIDELAAMHEERLREAEAACDVPRSAAEIVPLLFRRKLDGHQLGFAVGETLAHLHRAVATGRLVRSERADGVWLFARRNSISSPTRSSMPSAPRRGGRANH